MTEPDLRRRFGDDPNLWPEPHRTEALGTQDPLHAALMQPTDYAALSRAVLTRLVTPQRRSLDPRLALAGYASLLIAVGVTGYSLTDLPADPLLALALGEVPMMERLQ
jgi:hypothetical protein